MTTVQPTWYLFMLLWSSGDAAVLGINKPRLVAAVIVSAWSVCNVTVNCSVLLLVNCLQCNGELQCIINSELPAVKR